MPSHKSTLQQKNHSKWQWELYTQKSQCQKKDLSREKLIGRWKQLLTLRMTLPGLKKTDVLQGMAKMCPGHEASFEEVKHICEQRDFYMAPPKRQKKKSDDGAPSVPNAPDPPRKLVPLEVHFINYFYLKLKKKFETNQQPEPEKKMKDEPDEPEEKPPATVRWSGPKKRPAGNVAMKRPAGNQQNGSNKRQRKTSQVHSNGDDVGNQVNHQRQCYVCRTYSDKTFAVPNVNGWICSQCAQTPVSEEEQSKKDIWLKNVHDGLEEAKQGGVIVILCKGTGSVDEVFKLGKFNIVSIDFDKAFINDETDLLCSITEWTTAQLHQFVVNKIWNVYRMYPRILAVWMSPQCTAYSQARTTKRGKAITEEEREEDRKKADLLVKQCLQYAKFLGVDYIVENPWTGDLKNRSIMKGEKDPIHVDYCKYSAYANPCCPPMTPCALCKYKRRYQKPTALWASWDLKLKEPTCTELKCEFCRSETNYKHPERCTGQQAHKYPVPGRLTADVIVSLCERLRDHANP